MIGETLGGYRITRKIGEGGMGVVYEAEHVMIGRRAAIKCLLPELSSNAEACGRFFIEAQAAAMTNHPSLVDIYDRGHTESGSAYIIMEFLDGEDLGTFLRREGKFKLRMAVAITRQVASALGAVHTKGIVHRDLKPDNLFLVKVPGSPGSFRVKVLDFGIAKLTGPENKDLSVKTRTGSVIGTPSYMSPEQCRGHGKVDWRSDIYALGCILQEMIVGFPPFRGSGYGEVLAQHIYEPPPPIRTMDHTVPPELEALILRTLVKNPEQRLQTMDELAAALDNLFNAPAMISMGGSAGTSTTPAEGVVVGAGPPMMTPVGLAAPTPQVVTQPAPVLQEQPRTTTLRGTASQAVRKDGKKGGKVGVSLALAGAAAVAIGVVAFVAVGGSAKSGQATAVASPSLPSTPEAKPEVKPEVKPEPAPEPVKPAPEPAVVATPEPPKPEPPKPEPAVVKPEPVVPKPEPEPEPAKPVTPPPPAKVHVSLRSEPAGAEVFRADGTRLGKTPIDQDLLSGSGKLAYVVKLAGYKDGHVELAADKGGEQIVKLVAEPKAPKVIVATPPPVAAPSPIKQATPPKKAPKDKNGVVNPFGK